MGKRRIPEVGRLRNHMSAQQRALASNYSINVGDISGSAQIVIGHGSHISAADIAPLADYIRCVHQARTLRDSEEPPQFFRQLKCYSLVRPGIMPGDQRQPAEIWVTLINDSPAAIELIEVHPPHTASIQSLPAAWTLRLPVQIPPYKAIAALRYVIPAETPLKQRLVPDLPRVTYRIQGGDLQLNEITRLEQHDADCTELFVPLIDREDLHDYIALCLQSAEECLPPFWLAFADRRGTGRSRALHECMSMALQKGIDVLNAQAQPVANTIQPVEPICTALKNRLHLPTSDLASDIRHVVAWLILDGVECDLSDTAIALFAKTLRENKDDPQSLTAIVDCLVQRATIAPLLLVIDDLHYAPPATSTILEQLRLRRMNDHGIRLAVCMTHTQASNLSPNKQYFQDFTFPLRDLNTREVRRFVEYWLPDLHCPPDQWRALVRFLGGRPLLIRAGLYRLVNDGRIRLDADHWIVHHSLPGIQFPKPVHPAREDAGLAMLLAQYEHFWETDNERWLAQALRLAAVIGSEFEYTLWEQALHDPEVGVGLHAHEARDVLMSRDLIEPVDSEDGSRGMYRFISGALRDAILAKIRLDKQMAQQLHGLVARLLAPAADTSSHASGRYAYHLLASFDGTMMAEAFNRFRTLAEAAAQNSRLDEAIEFYHAALDTVDKSTPPLAVVDVCHTKYKQLELLERRGEWRIATTPAAVLAIECTEAQLYELAAAAHILCGELYLQLGESAETERHYTAAATLASKFSLPNVEARVWRKQAALKSKAGEKTEAHEYYLRALALPQSLDDFAQAQASCAENLRQMRRLPEAYEHMQVAVEACETLNKLPAAERTVLRIQIQAGILACDRDELEQSAACLTCAATLAERLEAVNEHAYALKWLSTVRSRLDGDQASEDTLQLYAAAIEQSGYLGNQQARQQLFEEYAMILEANGEYGRLFQLCERARRLGITNNRLERLGLIAAREQRENTASSQS